MFSIACITPHGARAYGAGCYEIPLTATGVELLVVAPFPSSP